MSGAILVIGGSGFLGQRLVTAFPGRCVVGTFYSRPQNGMQFLNLRDSRTVCETLHSISPSVILYAAGLTDVDICERNPELAWSLNAMAAATVASYGEARTIYFSTDYVFNGNTGQYREDDQPMPLNVYGKSKLAGEHAVLTARAGNIVIRVSGLYDDKGIKGTEYSKIKQPLRMDDTRLSNPVHINDVISAVRLLLEQGKGGIYHVAGPDTLSRYEFWQVIALKYPVEVSPVALNTGLAPRPHNSSLRTDRIQSLGWRGRRVSELLKLSLPTDREGLETSYSSCSLFQRSNGVLVDCVGGLLTPRTWLYQSDSVFQTGITCATVKRESHFWQTITRSLDFKEADLPDEKIASCYAPNPTIWKQLRYWRTRYKMALVSNGPAVIFRHWISKYGLEYAFDLLANSEEMGLRKQDQKFFLRVSEDLGLAPERCMLLSDDPDNINGALKCGIYAFRTINQYRYPLAVHSLDQQAESFLERMCHDNVANNRRVS